jgi:hypothetical protein
VVNIVDFKPLNFVTAVGSKPAREAIQLSLQHVSQVLLWCQFMPEIMHRGAPELGFPPPVKLDAAGQEQNISMQPVPSDHGLNIVPLSQYLF